MAPAARHRGAAVAASIAGLVALRGNPLVSRLPVGRLFELVAPRTRRVPIAVALLGITIGPHGQSQ